MKKLSKRKLKRFLVQAVLYTTVNLMWTGIMIFGFLQNTIY